MAEQNGSSFGCVEASNDEITWIEVERFCDDGPIPAIVSFRGETFVFKHIASRGDENFSCYYEKQACFSNYSDRPDLSELMALSVEVDAARGGNTGTILFN